MTKLEAINEMKEVCYEIGCSGVGKSCPGNVNCSIIRKIFRKELIEYLRKNISGDIYNVECE